MFATTLRWRLLHFRTAMKQPKSAVNPRAMPVSIMSLFRLHVSQAYGVGDGVGWYLARRSAGDCAAANCGCTNQTALIHALNARCTACACTSHTNECKSSSAGTGGGAARLSSIPVSGACCPPLCATLHSTGFHSTSTCSALTHPIETGSTLLPTGTKPY